MAIANFKPEVWASRLTVALQKSLVYAAPGVVNRDYEGEISQYGDTVHITNLADPTIGTYTAHTDITIEDVDDADTVLTITQSPYFAFEVDDIEKRQARGDVMGPQAQRAGYLLRDKADQYVANLMATGVDAGNLIAESTLSTAAAAYEMLVDLGVSLDEDNVPTEGRFVVVTPKFYGLLLKDQRFVAAGDAQGATVRANGYVGQAAGFDVRKSNNAPDGPGAGRWYAGDRGGRRGGAAGLLHRAFRARPADRHGAQGNRPGHEPQGNREHVRHPEQAGQRPRRRQQHLLERQVPELLQHQLRRQWLRGEQLPVRRQQLSPIPRGPRAARFQSAAASGAP